ncbi:hypothetical protein FGE12_13115 [Aggregicoccus sp. 17bor-14]|uniref:hypothetical protein n=1 Tax=Myxococcaceae TaxID=31 RepID=UPI00129C1B71|nr:MULTISPECIES: hypothetical protein [Myxococcaceae]MBF5043331.1 hypothetical protein [Simulacricoccus sp. 17bor-14]MRI89090.1 hypothetical protein [Aggregicoccus sp. 17bor-14]
MKTMLTSGLVAALLGAGAAHAGTPASEQTQGNTKAGATPPPCLEPQSSAGTGTAGSQGTATGGAGTAGTQESPPPAPPPPPAGSAQGEVTPPSTPAPGTGGAGVETSTSTVTYHVERKSPVPQLMVTLGGGLDGYTSRLAPEISPGPAAAATVAFQPLPFLGLEAGYSGSLNELRNPRPGEVHNGADIVRNGGHADLTLGVPTPVQPYLLGGIGFSHYNVRATSARFHDDTVGDVPVGLGVRTTAGRFSADLRGTYNFLFSQEFARGVSTGLPEGTSEADLTSAETGRYLASLTLGVGF